MTKNLPPDCWVRIAPEHLAETFKAAADAMEAHYTNGKRKQFAAEHGIGYKILYEIYIHLNMPRRKFLPWDSRSWPTAENKQQRLVTWCCAIVKLGEAIKVDPLVLAELLRVPRNTRSENIISGGEIAQPLAPRRAALMPLRQATKILPGQANYQLTVEVGPGEEIEIIRRKKPPVAPG